MVWKVTEQRAVDRSYVAKELARYPFHATLSMAAVTTEPDTQLPI